MRIGLNLLPVREGIGGTWSYIGGLVRALGTHDHENEYVVFATEASEALVPRQPNFRVVLSRVPARWRSLRVLYESTLFRRTVAHSGIDCLHHVFGTLPAAGPLPTVVTMYDLIEFERPDDFSFIKRLYLRSARRHAGANATIIAPMSYSTADHIHERLGVPRDRMEVVLPPLNHDFIRQPDSATEAFRSEFGLPRQFWLAIADPLPRKNHERLLEAVTRLHRERPGGWPLVIRGEPTRDFLDRVAGLGLGGVVSFLPRLSDEQMPLLYSAASALVFPSIFEGGGLPVVEALACECPVVASNIATTLEFAEHGALTFEPLSVPSIVEAMRECEEDSAARARRAKRGLAGAARLRPAAVVAACREAYRRAMTDWHSARGTLTA